MSSLIYENANVIAILILPFLFLEKPIRRYPFLIDLVPSCFIGFNCKLLTLIGFCLLKGDVFVRQKVLIRR